MKKTICSFLLLVAAGSMPTFSQTLVFHLTGGAKSTVALPATFTVTPTGDKLVIEGGNTVVELAKDDVMCVTYRDKKGDVNGDQTVDVADIATIISIMAGAQEPVKTVSVTTGNVTNITQSNAVVEGSVENVDLPVNVGVLYGTSSTLSIDSDKKVTTTSSGNYTITLTELNAGTTYYYCAFAEIDGKYYYGETKVFMTANFLCPDDKHPHLIDLGLPSGTKWSCCNLGATKPTQYGQYYLWTGSDLVKESGLEEWQMPTMEDGQELIDNCYYEWITYEAVNGCVFTGINGNKIFFPATGWLRNDYTEVNIGGEGNYWTITSNGGSAAYDLQFDANRVFMDSGGLTTGLQTIRPVQKR